MTCATCIRWRFHAEEAETTLAEVLPPEASRVGLVGKAELARAEILALRAEVRRLRDVVALEQPGEVRPAMPPPFQAPSVAPGAFPGDPVTISVQPPAQVPVSIQPEWTSLATMPPGKKEGE